MKNKAFTLVELLGVIVLLGILSVVIIPKVGDSIKNSKETSYLAQEDMIKKATNDFLIENTNLLESNQTITITLGSLKQGGYLPINIKNPKTKKDFSNESLITITRKGNTYDIQLNLVDLENVTENIDSNSPILVLNGNYIEYVEVNTNYEDKGAYAYSSTGENLNVSNPTIKQNDSTISQINTSTLGTYNVIYEVTNNGKTTSATRTVIVRDSTSPTIIIPKDTTIHTSEVAGFDPLKGVSATDNYTNNVTVTANNSSLSNLPGNYIITYTATDSSGNTTTERRVINVDGNFANYYANLEYLQTNGNQKIIFDYKAKIITETRLDIELIENDITRTTGGNKTLIGINGSGENKFTANFGSTVAQCNQLFYWIDKGTANGATSYYKKYENITNRSILIMKSGSASFQGETIETAIKTADNTNEMVLLGANTSTFNKYYAKVYGFQIYEGNNLIMNLIPAKRNSDEKAGLYDIVNNKFYTSDGTQEFIKGNLIN